MDYFGLTDRGRVRMRNEDQFLIADLRKSLRVLQTSLDEDEHQHLSGVRHGMLFIVADGMGGRAGGDLASGLVTETVTRYVLHTMPWFFQLRDGREVDLEYELVAALAECQRSVEAAAVHSGHNEMGTTLTMAYLLWPRLYVVHAGDSRCYLFRDGKAHQITRDHTLAQQMVERGILSPAQAETSRWSHALVKCVGAGSSEHTPDVYKATLRPHDTVLMCTDGLTRYVQGEAIREVLSTAATAEGAARELVDLANAGGGDDNITVVVVRCGDPDRTAESPAARTGHYPAAG